jgi:chromosome segregation ATPase
MDRSRAFLGRGLAAWLTLLLCGGCSKWFGNADLDRCEADRRRLNSELSETRKLRDQYRTELDKANAGTATAVTAAGSTQQQVAQANAAADAARGEARSARGDADRAAADARLAQESLRSAEARNAALQREMADLNSQIAKLRTDLAAESEQRPAAERKAMAADQANTAAAAARAQAADLQKQLDAASREKQQLTLQVELLTRQLNDRPNAGK